MFVPTKKFICVGLPITLLLLFWFVAYVRRKPADESSSLILMPPASEGQLTAEAISLKEYDESDLTAEEIVEPDDYPRNDGVKVILFYVPFFGHADYYFGLGRKPFINAGCKVTACETTTDRRRLNESDAVVVHPFDVNWDKDPVPKMRGSRRLWRQRWILHISESADNANFDWSLMDGVFNWTTCYREDCDVHHPYLRVTAKKPKTEKEAATVAPAPAPAPSPGGRRGLVSWLVSNCATKGRREEYVDELKKHIPVDVYGNCGKPCNKACAEHVYDDYKFYLAFENSICKDYVTEKLLNPLKHRRTVPVVYGGADYGRIAPPHSVIDVRDFDSPKHLADYLKMLDGNDTLYERYFDWKRDYDVAYVSPFCDLCAKLHAVENEDAETGSFTSKVYADLREWYVDKAQCLHEPLGMSPRRLSSQSQSHMNVIS